MAASEAHPFAKTGGLAEVTGALPVALARLGHRVTLVLPRYRTVDAGPAEQAVLSIGGRAQPVGFASRQAADGVEAVFVDAPDLFDREALYGTAAGDYADNAWRFAVFSRAVLEYVRRRGERPSVIHAHDWQAGLVPAYQKMQFSSDPTVGGVPVVFTIHNLAFQGVFPPATLDEIGLGWEVFNLQAMEYWGQISYLKAGINFSEKITTVSPNYAREILTPDMGFGFDGVLSRRRDDLVGILNGIDTERWNPQADPYVTARFSPEDLSGKARAREQLLESMGLPRGNGAHARPVIGLIARLTDQKGMDLIAAAAEDLMGLDATWTVLGNGEPRYEELWTRLAARYPDRVAARIGFDERLAHEIEAGADLFLMPSRFEPCGLNQLYSLRYGTVPVVRATGGLEDTVDDYDPATGDGTGFKFQDYTPGALVRTVTRAVELFPNKSAWKRLQVAGMRRDPSWDVSAREYVKVYRSAAPAARARREVAERELAGVPAFAGRGEHGRPATARSRRSAQGT
jgi:starch synthase